MEALFTAHGEACHSPRGHLEQLKSIGLDIRYNEVIMATVTHTLSIHMAHIAI